MLSPQLHAWLEAVVDFALLALVLVFVALVLAAVGMWIHDRYFQSAHAVRRNYPLLGRFRYFFERMGEFFRQYFFAMDREELPFNRAQRARSVYC